MARDHEKSTEDLKITCRVGLDIGHGAMQSAVEFNLTLDQ